MVENRYANLPPFLRRALWLIMAVLLVAALLVVGILWPKRMIDPGIHRYAGEERRIADAFYSYEMWREFGEGPEAYIVTGARVTEVRRCLGAPPYDPQSTYTYGTEISGTIRVHTIFGLHYRSIEATCGRVAAG